MLTEFSKKYLSIFYCNKPSDSLIVSSGVLLGGIFVITLSNLFFGNVDQIFFLYAFFTWLWLRTVEIALTLLIKIEVNNLTAFSLSWSLPILMICFLGFFKFTIPIIFLSLIGAFDFFIYLTVCLYNKINLRIKIILSGFLIGSSIIFLSTIHSTTVVWLNQTAHLGIIAADYFRDAALVNSWSEYSVMSQGIHGLMSDKYHFLFVFFTSPFINSNVDVIQAFSIFAYILIPTIIVYGCSKLIIFIGYSFFSKNWAITLLIFVLTFLTVDYVLAQRSVLFATLLYISAIPIVFNMVVNKKNSILDTTLLSLLIPMTAFARVYHGLFLLGISIYFIFYKKLSHKIILIISIFLTITLLTIYFGEINRYDETKFIYGFYKYFLKSSQPYINSYLIPIIIFFFLINFKKNFLNYENFKKITGEKFLFFLIFCCIIITLLALRAHQRESFYQLLPFYWLIFFFIISPQFLKIFFPLTKVKKFFESKKIKFSIFFLIFLASLSFSKKYLNEIHSDNGTIKSTIKSIRILNNNWKFEGGNKIFIQNIKAEDCKNLNFNFFCKIRTKIFGVSDLDKFVKSLDPAIMLYEVKKIKLNLKGLTAVYISPNNNYWSFFKYGKGKDHYYKLSRYFLVMNKMPMIFGVYPDDKRRDHNKDEAKINNGTLYNLNIIGNDEEICFKAKKVKIENIIIFEKGVKISRILKCN